MTTVLLCIIAFLVLLVLFFATGKKTPSHPTSELPEPSIGVQLLARESRVIDAIKLYRKETGSSLHEAKQVVESIRSRSRAA